MPLWRPRQAAELIVPIATNTPGTDDPTVSFFVRVRSSHHEKNDHNHADSLKLTIEWADAGIDPRLLSNAVVKFYLGNADEANQWAPSDADLRFVGIATRVQRRAQEGEGFAVEIEFLDYTCLFLQMKPFPPFGYPDYTQSLDDAWRRICDHVGVYDPSAKHVVSTVEQLKNALVPVGLPGGFPSLKKAVAPRFAKASGKISPTHGEDAWAVWQKCVGMMGLISYVDKDRIIVTTATDYYTDPDIHPEDDKQTGRKPATPKLIWGKNITSMHEARQSALSGKGVGLTSFDPLTGVTIEALYPPIGDPRVLRKKVAAKKASNPTAVREASDYEYFSDPGITDPDALYEKAKRVFEERSRQEFEGTIRTGEMSVDTIQGGSFDLLTLGSGELVRVEFDETLQDLLLNAPTETAKILILKSHGYNDGVAQLLASNESDITKLQPNFFTKTVRITLETSHDGGSFEVDINYVNRIVTTKLA